MNDRELLEAAAKAAGLNVQHMALSGFNIMSGPAMGKTWNPLTDDGDALRLAVKLGIEIGNFHQYGRALASIGHTRGSGEFWEIGDDPYAVTRRAITRAAAAMDKGGDR